MHWVVRTFALLLFTSFFAAASFAQTFNDGVTAYDQGQLEAAFKIWLPLAEQGHVSAQFNVAAMYEKGTGVAQDAAEAARWYLAAAKQGEVDAEYKVGMLYESGTGLTKDPVEAKKWYSTLIADPRNDKGTLTAKQLARQRLAQMIDATQEVIGYDRGRFVIVRSHDGACVVALQGMITTDASRKFDDVVTRTTKLGCGKLALMLESPGGGMNEGLGLARTVRSRGFATITRYDCASACAYIFMGGVERTLVGSRAAIGLHQSATIRFGTAQERHCDGTNDVGGVRDVKRFLAFAIPTTSDQVFDIVMHTSCDAITWIHGKQALDLGIATAVESENVDLFGPKADKH